MWCSRIAGVLILALVPADAQAAASGCEPSLTAQGKTYRLDAIELFDGPPEERVLLAPVYGRWDLAPIRSSERDFYLVCKYRGLAQTRKILVPKQASWCRVAGSGAKLAVACG